MKNLGVDDDNIKIGLEKLVWEGVEWITGFILFRTGTSCGLLWTRYCTL